MSGIFPKGSHLATNSLRWLADLTALFSIEEIKIPEKYRDKVIQTKRLLENDISGLVNSMLDFAISCADVNFSIEVEEGEKVLETLFEDWKTNINRKFNGEVVHSIPSGIRALAKEYYRERWKGSSFLLLRTIWENKDGFYLPTQLAFVDGEDIKIRNEYEDTAVLGDEKYSLIIEEAKAKFVTRSLPIDKKDEILFVQKPYDSWSTTYPTPYLIRRGIFKNLKFIELLQKKGEKVLGKALEYLFLLRKGTEQLALTGNPDFTYSEAELNDIKSKLGDLTRDMKSENGLPAYVTQFDTEIEHLIPEYSKIINTALYEPMERKILTGLGLVEIARGVASDRKESIMNPKPFIAEIESGIEGFKGLLKEIVYVIIDKNKEAHPKYAAKEITVHNTPITEFITDEIKTHLRSAYDRGVLSKRSYCEIVTESDLDIEIERRKKEKEVEKVLYPPITQNQESSANEGEQPIKPEVIKKESTTEDKTGIEKKNFNKSEEEVIEIAILKKEKDGWHIYSEKTGKHLGGPYSKKKALERLRAIEWFKKHKSSIDIETIDFDKELENISEEE